MPSRRDFLRIVLLGSGALYLSPSLSGCNRRSATVERTMNVGPEVSRQQYENPHRFIREHQRKGIDWQDAVSHTADVTIVGAGPAGLTAAVLLRKAGYGVLLLDSEPIGGGAARAGSFRDQHYPLASIYFVEQNDIIRELCIYAEIEPTMVPPDAVIVEGHPVEKFWDDSVIASLPLPRSERAELRRFRDDLLDMRARGTVPVYPLPEVLPPTASKLDAQRASDFLAAYHSPFLHTLLDLYARSSMGDSLENINAYSLLNFYSSELDTPRYTFSGGLGGLSTRIVEKLGDCVKTGMTSFHVEDAHLHPTTWAIDTTGRLHRFQSRVAIIAVQKFMLPWVIAELPDVQKAAMHTLHYSPFLTVHLCAQHPLLPAAFDLWVPNAPLLFTDIINANATGHASSTSSVASIYAPRSAIDRAMMQSDDVLAAFARRIAEHAIKTVPTIRGDAIEEVHVFGWGHALVVPTPGSHSGTAQAARQPLGRILFANTDNDAAPAFENAVAHGTRAAEQAMAMLKQ